MRKINLINSKEKIVKLEAFFIALSISYFSCFWVIYLYNEISTALGYSLLVILTLILYFIVKKFILSYSREDLISLLPFCLMLGLISLSLVLSSIYYLNKFYTEYIHNDGNINYKFIGWKQNIWIISYILPSMVLIVQAVLLYKLRKQSLRKSLRISLKNTLKLIGKLLLLWLISLIIVSIIFTIFNLSGGFPFG